MGHSLLRNADVFPFQGLKLKLLYQQQTSKPKASNLIPSQQLTVQLLFYLEMIFEGITVVVTDENGKPFEEYTNDPDLQQTNEISSTFVAIPDASESQYFKVKLTDSREEPFEKGFGIEAVFSIGMCRDADSNNAKITRYLHDNTKEVKFGGSSRLFFKKLTISGMRHND